MIHSVIDFPPIEDFKNKKTQRLAIHNVSNCVLKSQCSFSAAVRNAHFCGVSGRNMTDIFYYIISTYRDVCMNINLYQSFGGR